MMRSSKMDSTSTGFSAVPKGPMGCGRGEEEGGSRPGRRHTYFSAAIARRGVLLRTSVGSVCHSRVLMRPPHSRRGCLCLRDAALTASSKMFRPSIAASISARSRPVAASKLVDTVFSIPSCCFHVGSGRGTRAPINRAGISAANRPRTQPSGQTAQTHADAAPRPRSPPSSLGSSPSVRTPFSTAERTAPASWGAGRHACTRRTRSW